MDARLFLAAALISTGASAASTSPLQLQIDTAQARAVLALADLQASGKTPTEADWRTLDRSRGQQRLRERQESFHRPLDEKAFRAFVTSDDLGRRRDTLRASLDQWSGIDLSGAGGKAAAYLPANTVLRATVYPVIKPTDNSFVYDLSKNPAIFLYIDPAVSAEEFENTVAHELHHVGLTAACTEPTADGGPSTVAILRDWLGGFGEGRAMLAAAGGPGVHPLQTSAADKRAIWDRDLAQAASDLPRMETFFLAILDSRLGEDERNRQGMAFINDDVRPQGPFYTLGWTMAATVERAFGRERLVASSCTPERLLLDYDEAAAALNAHGDKAAPLPRWSPAFLQRLKALGTEPPPK